MIGRHLRTRWGDPAINATSTHRSVGRCEEYMFDAAKAGFGKGQSFILDDDECLISVVDFRLHSALRSHMDVLEDLLVVRVNIGACSTYGTAGNEPWRFMRPAVTVSVLPRGSQLTVTVEGDAVVTGVSIVMRPSALVERFGMRVEDLPQALRPLMDSQVVDAEMLTTLALEADLARLVEDLVHSRLTAPLRGLQVRARAVELMVLVIAAWNRKAAEPSFPGLRDRDAELVDAARRILTERMAAPPTLHELAQELGTNRSKLNHIFQRGMGVTLKSFCVQRRMERAQALLQEGRLNVGQIAETVGYQHQSSFAAAFWDMVGVCPRDYGNAKASRSVAEPALQ
jgi:AraC-like DNA-binding protein